MAADAVAVTATPEAARAGRIGQIKKPLLAGLSAGVLLLIAYAGIIVLAQGWGHAVDQSAKLWYWLVLLTVGFGAQFGLFVFIRQELKRRQRAATASMAGSGALSVGSMAACCAHHLTDVMALLGISGVAAFLVNYQVAFIVVGIASNAIGIATMLEIIQRHQLCPIVGGFRSSFGRVRRWTLASSSVIVLVVFLATFLARGG